MKFSCYFNKSTRRLATNQGGHQQLHTNSGNDLVKILSPSKQFGPPRIMPVQCKPQQLLSNNPTHRPAGTRTYKSLQDHLYRLKKYQFLNTNWNNVFKSTNNSVYSIACTYSSIVSTIPQPSSPLSSQPNQVIISTLIHTLHHILHHHLLHQLSSSPLIPILNFNLPSNLHCLTIYSTFLYGGKHFFPSKYHFAQ